MTIYHIQLPEQTAPVTPPPAAQLTTPAPAPPSERTNPSPNTYPPPPQAPPNVTTAPAPTTTTQNNTNPQSMTFWAFFWHHLRTDPQARMCKDKFISYRVAPLIPLSVDLILFIFLTCIVRIILSPTLSFLFVACTYSLIWLPQIWRSIKRGRSSGMTAEYVLGITVCRLYLVLCKYYCFSASFKPED